MLKKTILAGILASLMAGVSYAEQASIPMPADNRLVTFNYDANDSYTILSLPGSVTHIELAPDEEVKALAVGDSVQWKIEKTRNHVFIRPSKEGIFTSATMVTNKRTYQMTLRSSPKGGKWFQRVSWQYPDMIQALPADTTDQPRVAKKDGPSEDTKAIIDALKKLEPKEKPPVAMGAHMPPMYPVENLNFEYDIAGDASFKPEQVFDDGTFTYIRLPSSVRSMPALFIKAPDGKLELVNYTVNDRLLKAQGIMTTGVLKLGEQQIELTNRMRAGKMKPSNNSIFSLFGN